MVHLVINTYRDARPQRNAELEDALLRNKRCPHIRVVHEIPDPPRLTIRQLLAEAVRRVQPDDVVIIANTDIYFDDTARWLEVIAPQECFALSRYEGHQSEQVSPEPHRSQDAWVFRGLPPDVAADFTLGAHGCDNRLNRLLLDAGYAVYNPSLSIKAHHLHISGLRPSPPENKIPGPYHFPPACTIDYIQSCHRILAEHPDRAEALSLVGAKAFETGDPQTAAIFFRRAIALRPDRAIYHRNLGFALAASEEFSSAVDAYREALKLDPANADAYHKMAVALRRLGKWDQAVDACLQSVALRPDSPETLNGLGNCYIAKADWPRAIECFQQALALQPDYAEAHSNLGFVLQSQNRLPEAIAAYRRALALRPQLDVSWCHLGNALAADLQWDEAIAAYQRAIAIRPDFYEVYVRLADALRAKGDYPASIAACRRVLDEWVDYAEASDSMGQSLLALGDLDGAQLAHERALRMRPGYAPALANLGNVYYLRGQFAAAAAEQRKALHIQPDLAEAHWNLARILLLRGDFQEGFAQFEWRRKAAEFRPGLPEFPQPTWDGGDLAGRTILLHAERDIGDTILFARYLPLVAQRGGKIILLAQPSMQRLLRTIPGIVQCLTFKDSLPEFDVHCPLPSLPHVMALTRPQDAPWQGPYLHADAPSQQMFSDLLQRAQGRLKVGLACPPTVQPGARSISLAMLAGLANPGIQFYWLQPAENSRQSPPPATDLNLIDPTQRLKDLADAAALIAQLDLIVSADGATAQLAGALDRPVWMLVEAAPDWRWMLDRSDSPWYPSLRLFRQKRPGDWAEPIGELIDALQGQQQGQQGQQGHH
ncbi:MAG: tetratricopeptide repeat protein [Tepidisphaeraceae bacterium]|jgi:tetratricopeptide (TPR) repeat protein